MIISKKRLFQLVRRRLPSLSGPATVKYVNTVLDIIIERLCITEQPVIIDNFGILSRRKFRPKKVKNVVTKEHIHIITNSIFLRPSYAFRKYFKDKENRPIAKERIIRKSKQIMKEREGSIRKNVI